MSRAQNVDLVDLDVIDDADGPDDVAVARKIDINFFAQFRRELFGIVELPVPKFLGQDHRRSDNGTSERAAARFIDSGDVNDTDRAQFLFVTKSATRAACDTPTSRGSRASRRD